MPKHDLFEYSGVLAQKNGRQYMRPVIEKELLHYEILSALEKADLLSSLVFQGGTCLRLCYGADRYSEDLDFAGGKDFNAAYLKDIKTCIENALTDKFLGTVEVQEPDVIGGFTTRWRIRINTAPARSDMPMQKISLEVAAIPAYTKKPSMLRLNYDGLIASYADTIVYTESLEEILADKLEAFVCAEYVRYRDIWDMHWLSRKPDLDITQVYELRKKKEIDYNEAEKFSEGVGRIITQLDIIVEGRDFQEQMKRFLPTDLFDATIGRKIYRDVLIDIIRNLYRADLL
jgi:predicted nucleotidyltransferase component of viral defense system